MIDEHYNFCEGLDLAGRSELQLTSDVENLNLLFSIILEDTNAINFGEIQLFMMDKNNPANDEIYQQIKSQVKLRGEEICQNKIDEGFLQSSLEVSRYLFFIVFQDADIGCRIAAFRFFSSSVDNTELYSRLVCALEGKREVDVEVDGLVEQVVLKSGLGAVITFKAAQWAKSKGFRYFWSKAASLRLVEIYREWGFHLGKPELILDQVFDASLERKTNKKSENAFYQECLQYLYNQVEFGAFEEVIKKLRITVDEYDEMMVDEDLVDWNCRMSLNKIMDLKASQFLMFIDLESEDYDKLENFARTKFERFVRG